MNYKQKHCKMKWNYLMYVRGAVGNNKRCTATVDLPMGYSAFGRY